MFGSQNADASTLLTVGLGGTHCYGQDHEGTAHSVSPSVCVPVMKFKIYYREVNVIYSVGSQIV